MSAIKVNGIYNVIGDDTSTCSMKIREAGENMFATLRQLVASGGLEGDGIQQALEASHTRWNAACESFAIAEQRFAQQAHNTYIGTLDRDVKLAGNFNYT